MHGHSQERTNTIYRIFIANVTRDCRFTYNKKKKEIVKLLLSSM
jgi:hypothetical protein